MEIITPLLCPLVTSPLKTVGDTILTGERGGFVEKKIVRDFHACTFEDTILQALPHAFARPVLLEHLLHQHLQ